MTTEMWASSSNKAIYLQNKLDYLALVNCMVIVQNYSILLTININELFCADGQGRVWNYMH